MPKTRKNNLKNNTRKKLNVLGKSLSPCSSGTGAKTTGFFRTGFCTTGPSDTGTHVICSRVTNEFLLFSKSQGNDLISPSPESGFPGLKDGDKWCLCAYRWLEAYKAGKAPPVILKSTNKAVLRIVPLKLLKGYAV